ncbi:DUF4238 domain-containing protein [Bradyrhizobium sp. USDA 4473]
MTAQPASGIIFLANRVTKAARVARQQKKKRNHWVSQSYLRPFSVDDERRRVWVMKRDSREDPELKPIKKVATQFYLYAPFGPNGRDYTFEDKLASLEQQFGGPFWKSVTTGFVDLCDAATRKILSLLVAVMYLRNPLQLEQMHAMHEQIVGFYSQHSKLPDAVEIAGKSYEIDKDSWPSYRSASEDDIKRMWLDQVGSATWLAKILVSMRWAVLFSEEPVFITTDNAVVVIHPSLEFRGLRNAETTMLFPLSPTRLLHIDNRMSEPDGQYYPFTASPGALNGLLWRCAINAMYSSRHPDIVCAEICADAGDKGFAPPADGMASDGEPQR